MRDGLQAEVDSLKLLQAAIAAELDALLPANLGKAFKEKLWERFYERKLGLQCAWQKHAADGET